MRCPFGQLDKNAPAAEGKMDQWVFGMWTKDKGMVRGLK